MDRAETKIRPARPGEGVILSDLAVRSKFSWPYDKDESEAYRPHLAVLEADIRACVVFVLERDGTPIGFYSLPAGPGTSRLYFLFVEPEFIGRGFGKRLWLHALDTARRRGWEFLSFSADRYAADAFYRHQGGRVIGAGISDLGPTVEMRIEL